MAIASRSGTSKGARPLSPPSVPARIPSGYRRTRGSAGGLKTRAAVKVARPVFQPQNKLTRQAFSTVQSFISCSCGHNAD
jgi:hypothetical protein